MADLVHMVSFTQHKPLKIADKKKEVSKNNSAITPWVGGAQNAISRAEIVRNFCKTEASW